MCPRRLLPANTKGFTLVELLITMALLSSLLFTGTYAYSLISSRWDKELGHFKEAAETAKNLELLQKCLEGIYPSAVYSSDKRPAYLFIGGEDRIISVTRSGLFNEDRPEIFKLIFEPTGNGSFDLIYQSVSKPNFLLLGAEQRIKFDRQITLFRNLTKGTIEYNGWVNYETKQQSEETGGSPVWSKKYSGLDSSLLPEKLIFSFFDERGQFSLPVSLQKDTEYWYERYQPGDI